MADQGATAPHDESAPGDVKGKGKAAEATGHDVSMDEEESSSEEEAGEVNCVPCTSRGRDIRLTQRRRAMVVRDLHALCEGSGTLC